MGIMNDRSAAIIAIDLDGTLIQSDMLIESFLKLIKMNPLNIILALVWLSKGKANLKHQIAQRVTQFPVENLPYNQDVIEYIRQKRKEGHKVVLATATHRQYADAIARHLGIFDEVLASDATTNLSGDRKRALLNERYGHKGYVYAGNANVDIPVWRESMAAVVVGNDHLVSAAKGVSDVERHILVDSPSIMGWVKALRLHQWVKNLLIFVPLLASHQMGDSYNVLLCIVAFFAFSLCASSVYLLNDLLDLNEDRQHPTKRNRPFAAGSLELIYGLIAAPILLIAAVSFAALVGVDFFLVLCAYYTLTLAYSFYLKRVVLVDVLTLAGLYTLRIIAGAAALSMVPSFWLLAFSVFVFLSLALVKRYTELLLKQKGNSTKALGRGYVRDDISLLGSLGTSSAYMSVLVLALYINSADVKVLYHEPMLVWPICLVVMFWISRVWLVAHRGEMTDDPIVFAIKDRVSIVCGVLVVFFMLMAA